MSIISTKSAQALRNGTEYKNNNTQVCNNAMFLHNNKIAWIQNNRLFYCLCGWDTRTTCERLRALDIAINHRRGRLFCGDKAINDTDTFYIDL